MVHSNREQHWPLSYRPDPIFPRWETSSCEDMGTSILEKRRCHCPRRSGKTDRGFLIGSASRKDQNHFGPCLRCYDATREQLDALSGSETPSVGSDTTRCSNYPSFHLTYKQHASKNGAFIAPGALNPPWDQSHRGLVRQVKTDDSGLACP